MKATFIQITALLNKMQMWTTKGIYCWQKKHSRSQDLFEVILLLHVWGLLFPGMAILSQWHLVVTVRNNTSGNLKKSTIKEKCASVCRTKVQDWCIFSNFFITTNIIQAFYLQMLTDRLILTNKHKNLMYRILILEPVTLNNVIRCIGCIGVYWNATFMQLIT